MVQVLAPVVHVAIAQRASDSSWFDRTEEASNSSLAPNTRRSRFPISSIDPMSTPSLDSLQQILAPIASHARAVTLAPDYPAIEIDHPEATATVALHGAHLTAWQPRGQNASDV